VNGPDQNVRTSDDQKPDQNRDARTRSKAVPNHHHHCIKSRESRYTRSERDPNRSEPDAMAGIIVTQPHCNICGTCFELKKSLLSVRKSAPPAKWEQLNPNKNCVNSHWKIIKLILILAAILILMRSEEKENAGQSCRVVRRSTYHLAFTTW